MTPSPIPELPEDDAVAAMLREALAVDPSPALRARVRARVALERTPWSHAALRAWAPVAAAVAIVAASTVVVSRISRVTVEPATPVTAAAAILAPFAAPVHAVFPSTTNAATGPAFDPVVAARERAGPPDARPRRPDPVVLRTDETNPPVRFAAGERDAFALVLALTRAGDLQPPDTLPPAMDGREVELAVIDILTIDITPLVIASPDEGERQ